MGIFDTLKRWLVGSPPQSVVRPTPPQFEDEEEPVVPEWGTEELAAALATTAPPFVLDVREPFEWRQAHMPFARHIPMNDVPQHLAELPQDRPIVVVCAHGSRSYSVAAWLNEQGYAATNLSGGVTRWVQSGGAVEKD